MPYNLPSNLKGLNDAELQMARSRFGLNQVDWGKKSPWYMLLLDIVKEPMLLLLIGVTIIYVLVGNYAESIFMLGAIVIVSGISFYQDNRSKKALEALEKLNAPLSTVIRSGEVVQIPTQEIAVGDLCVIEEGAMINADGIILHSNDFSVNESALTGESFSIHKSSESKDRQVYSGTVVVSGLAVFKVESIGAATQLGKIGLSIKDIKTEQSPLQIQISLFVKRMAFVGIAIFFLVWIYSYMETQDIIQSLLIGLTLAMSVLPEEIPVAFTTFMALGAWKLMKEGIIVKRSSVVETLGSTSVICTDKTGTITENSMRLRLLYDFGSDSVFEEQDFANPTLSPLIAWAMWSSEPVPFDPMEKTLHQVYEDTQPIDQRTSFHMVHEYPLDGIPPMMTHVFENQTGERIIAAKGAPEAILKVSQLSEADKNLIQKYIQYFGSQGYRVLGVAKSSFEGMDFPKTQQELPFEFIGLTVFFDPPKKDIQSVFQKINEAGIKIKVITGDNTDTTVEIARQAGINNPMPPLEGREIQQCNEEELHKLAQSTTLFTRMFPAAKLSVINALKQTGEVVAMLGDGINDAPALKAAHIGVGMGNKGTEIAKSAAALVITNDDLGKLITGIAAGRRIYTNIKKAIQYIISIHIPIILTVALPLLLGWEYAQLFTPVHVIFLELIMGPTCSIVYENEPMERNTMQQKPRKLTDTFLHWRELSISILQGVMITIGVICTYYYAIDQEASEDSTRAMVFSTLVLANVWLCLVNRSFIYSVWDSFKNHNRLFPIIIGASLVLLFCILYIPPVASFFKVTSLSLHELVICLLIAMISVLWFEVFKWWKRSTLRQEGLI
jgi:Ca2+-transporting ATPase